MSRIRNTAKKYARGSCSSPASIALKTTSASSAAVKKAPYKVPRYIRFVREMLMTVTGKAQKFVMRERMIEELKLNETKTA
jgi:acyl-coenzyme A synthetase/AMP-(fatty) acid ligase